MSERTVACIADGKVHNVIVVTADYELDPECEVEYTAENPAGIGWPYDGEKFIAPPPPPKPDPRVTE